LRLKKGDTNDPHQQDFRFAAHPECPRTLPGSCQLPSYCQYESSDDDEDFDFNLNLMIPEASEIDCINDLGPPEEIAIIRIESCGDIHILRLLDYLTEIFLTDSMLKPETIGR